MCVLVCRDVCYSLEPLETRRLLSAVSWDGGGDDSHWADPLKAWGDVLLKQEQGNEALNKYNEALKYAPNWAELKAATGGAQRKS